MKNIPPLRSFEAIFFDLDGTLIEGSDTHFAKIIAMTAEKLKIEIPPHHRGITLLHFLRIYFPHWNTGQIEAFLQENQKIYKETPRQIRLYNDVQHILNLTQDIPRGIVTNCNDIELQKTKEDISLDFVDTIVNKTKYISGKPNPDIYLKAAENLNVNPKKCLVFEDSEIGIHAGKNANMTVIAIDRFNDLEKTAADYYIKSFREIKK